MRQASTGAKVMTTRLEALHGMHKICKDCNNILPLAREVAPLFGVTYKQIQKIQRGETWARISGLPRRRRTFKRRSNAAA